MELRLLRETGQYPGYEDTTARKTDTEHIRIRDAGLHVNCFFNYSMHKINKIKKLTAYDNLYLLKLTLQ